VSEIVVDVWLYGGLAKYGGQTAQSGFANLKARLREGSTIGDLLAFLQMPSEERGITFINGQLSAMPGLQPDLGHNLADGDRVAFFHLNSMWPFQYRHGAAMIRELAEAMQTGKDGGLHHSYREHESNA
jgi:hypothetical protein